MARKSTGITRQSVQSQVAEIESFRGWSALTETEQANLKDETSGLYQDLDLFGQCRLKIGKRISKINDTLAPKRLAKAFMKKFFRMSQSTYFNYINYYKTAEASIPAPVLTLAITHNYNAISKAELVKRNPPPRTEDPQKIIAYLEGLEKMKVPKAAKADESPDQLLKRCFHSFSVTWDLLPADKKIRTRFSSSFLGMVMTRCGLSSSHGISPVAIPEEFRMARGRPKIKHELPKAA